MTYVGVRHLTPTYVMTNELQFSEDVVLFTRFFPTSGHFSIYTVPFDFLSLQITLVSIGIKHTHTHTHTHTYFKFKLFFWETSTYETIYLISLVLYYVIFINKIKKLLHSHFFTYNMCFAKNMVVNAYTTTTL